MSTTRKINPRGLGHFVGDDQDGTGSAERAALRNGDCPKSFLSDTNTATTREIVTVVNSDRALAGPHSALHALPESTLLTPTIVP